MRFFEPLALDPTMTFHSPFQIALVSMAFLAFGILGILGARRSGKPADWEAWPTHKGLQMRRKGAGGWEYRPATEAEQTRYVETEAW